ncbi:MAG: hypothetical protein AB7O91_12345 [Sphingomonas sp.]
MSVVAGAAAALFLLVFGGQDNQRPLRAPQAGNMTVRYQILVRVPRGVREIAPAGRSLIRWRERRGPRCIAAGQIVGATLLGQNSVDLLMRDRSRLRARLESRCPALDYYRGFYLDAAADGQVCADRDSVRSRAGGSCQIDAFRTLTPQRR